MLREIEYTYNNKDDNKTFYEDRVFEIMSHNKYRKLNSGINSLCEYTSKVIVRLKVSISNRILYRDSVDKCCYGYYKENMIL